MGGKFTGAELEKYKTELNASWTPISFHCDAIYLISRRGKVPFEIRHKIPLCPAMNEQKEDEIKADKADYSVVDTEPNIYFVIDTTGSMSNYISSLNQVLDQIFTMIKILFAGKASLHIISYKDYCDKKVIEECHDGKSGQSQSGTDGNMEWPCPACTFANKASANRCELCNAVKPPPIDNKLKQWVRSHLIASGGGDTPEAAKTALNVLYEYIINKD